MFFLLTLIGAAVSAVAGALAAHAAGEGDRQNAKHHSEVANRLNDDYSKLQKKYDRESSESQKQINTSLQRQALDETEKDFLRFALRLQQDLYKLMFDIDRDPTTESLKSFAAAVSATNDVLFQLKEETIQIPEGYFDRNLKRVTGSKAMLNLEKARSNINNILICDPGKHHSTCHASSTKSTNKYQIAPSRSRRSSDFMEWSD